MKKVFIFLLLLFISFDLRANEILPAKDILAKLKYKPDWDNCPTTKEIINAFEKDTGLNYKATKKECIEEDIVGNIINISQQKKDNCARIYKERIFLKQEGKKLNCKRKDLLRSIVLNSSDRLLKRDWPKYVYDDWYYKLKLPFLLDSSENHPICKFFAEKQNCLYGKYSFENIKDLPEIKEIPWNFDVAKSQAEIEFNKNNKNTDLDNNDDNKRGLCSSFYSNEEKIKASRILEIDIDNDGQQELVHFVWEPDNSYGAVYEKNIDRIKRYLKNKRLVIENEEHYLKIARKFRGKLTKESPSNDSPNFFCIPSFNINFLNINNKIYFYYSNHDDFYIITITNDKINYTCRFEQTLNLDDERYYYNMRYYYNEKIDIKTRTAQEMGLSHINDDNYLYDKSLLEEIRNFIRFSGYDEKYKREIKQFIYDNVNKVCNFDLYKFEKEQKKSLSNKDMLSKLKFKPEWDNIPTITDFRKRVESLEEKAAKKHPYFVPPEYKYFTDYKDKLEKLSQFYDTTGDFSQYRLIYLLRKYYDNNIAYYKKGKKLSCKRKDFFRSIVLDGSYWLLDRDWPKEIYDDWFYNLRSPFVLDYAYGNNNFDPTICDAFAKEHQCLGTKEITGKTVEVADEIKKYHWDYDVIKTQREVYAIEEEKPELPDIQQNVCSNYINHDKLDIYVNDNHTESFDFLDWNLIHNSKLMEIDFNNDGKKELIYFANNSPQIFGGVFFDNIDEVKKFLKTSDQIVQWEKGFKEILEKFNGLNITNKDYFSPDIHAYMILIIIHSNPYIFDFFKFKDKIYYYYNDEDSIYVLYKNENNEDAVSCTFYKTKSLFEKKEISYNYVKKLIAEDVPLFHLNNDEYFYAEDLLEEVNNLIPSGVYLEAKDYLFNKAKEICDIDLYELEKEVESRTDKK